MANTIDTVARLNRLVQQTRIGNGELDPTTHGLDVDGQRLLVGDDVVTPRNDRALRTDRGVMVKNRDHWTIETIHDDGAVSLTGRTGTVHLPAGYVAEWRTGRWCRCVGSRGIGVEGLRASRAGSGRCGPMLGLRSFHRRRARRQRRGG
jgi:hypothetical protein